MQNFSLAVYLSGVPVRCIKCGIGPSLSNDEVSMASLSMTLKTLSWVISISLIRGINYRCTKCRDSNAIHQMVCLPRLRLLKSSPLTRAGNTRLFFSSPQHQSSLLLHAHKTQRQSLEAQAHTHLISCESSLIELTPQLTT